MFSYKIFISFLSFFVIETTAQCATNDKLIGYTCYQFNSEYLNWYDSWSHCKAQGYTLASIHNLNQATAIGEAARQTFHNISGLYYWIGLTKRSTGWHWDDSTVVDYYNWASGYPTEYSYVLARAIGDQWFTLSGNNLYPHICTYYSGITDSTPSVETTQITGSPQDITTPTTTTTIPSNSSCQQGDIILNDRCYNFNKQYLSYTNARIQCGMIGKTLAIFDNLSQITFLSSYAQTQFGTTYASFWIGLQRDTASTPFYWQDGGSIQFTNWSPGYPYSGQLFVGQDIATTKWKTSNEDNLLFSVCSGKV